MLPGCGNNFHSKQSRSIWNLDRKMKYAIERDREASNKLRG
jgi:hypothetical protein